MAVLASIPSPARGVVEVGPLPLHLYGLIIAVGVLVAAWVAERRWVRRGHDGESFAAMVLWIVLGGVVGARLYHVITDVQLFRGRWLDAFKIWEGGLGIWGAVMGGGIVAIVLARRRHLDVGDLIDSIAPALVLAQAIGRWGNWANQELFGRPSTLPWAVEIDPAKRPAEYAQYSTFQPTFLYESLWCLAIFATLLVVERRVRLMKGQLFALYVMLYTAGRFVFENMRTDPANRIGPLRLNAWVAIVCFVLAALGFLWAARRGTPAVPDVRAVGDPGPGTAEP
ncbi:MAG: prolipoprotein diacylglyceryl transferase [Actinomycetes bacterium]